jgi:hypothetical protein
MIGVGEADAVGKDWAPSIPSARDGNRKARKAKQSSATGGGEFAFGSQNAGVVAGV